MDDLLSEFLIETSDRLAELDGDITRLASAPANTDIQAQLSDLFHTIRGAGGFLALVRLEAIAQACEDLLGRFKADPDSATPEAAQSIVEAAGVIRRVLTALAASGKEPAGDDTSLLAALRAANGEQPVTVGLQNEPAAPKSSLPVIDQIPTSKLAQPASSDPVIAETTRALVPTVSLPLDRLESFAGLVGELVQTRNTLNHLMSSRDDAELEESLQKLSHVTSDLGSGLVATRRQAFGQAATDMPGAFDIVTAVTVSCSGRRFAIPQRNVLELIWVTPTGAMGSANDEFRYLRLRDQRHPWIRLSTVLGLDMDRALARRREIVVMIQAGEETLGLSVEQVFDAEEIVVRPQPPLLKSIDLYSGNTILGDGGLALVLDPLGLLAELRLRQQKLLAERAASLPATQK